MTMPRIIVLVVDDEPLILEVTAAALEDAGYEVVQFSTGVSAWRYLSQPGLEIGGVVLDINLGSGQPTGWELASRIREISPKVPVIYATGDSSHEWAVKGVPHSVLLSKPYTPNKL